MGSVCVCGGGGLYTVSWKKLIVVFVLHGVNLFIRLFIHAHILG